MSEDSPPNRPAGHAAAGATHVSYLDQALWRQLAEADTAAQLCQSWLTLQSRMVDGVTCGLIVLEGPDGGAFVPTAVVPRGSREAERLTKVVERALTERRGVVVEAPDARFHVAYPVHVDDRVRAVAALEIGRRPQAELQSAMRQLQWGVAWIRNWLLREGMRPDVDGRSRLTAILELTSIPLEEERFQGAATAFVTELATRLHCDRVSIGFSRGRQVKVRALSHSAQFAKQMNLIRGIGMAMGESVDQHATLVYPEPEGRPGHVLQLHEQLARSQGDGAICTVPFGDRDGRPFGALTLERSASEPFDQRTVELCDGAAALVGPILELKRLEDRLLVTKLGSSLWRQARRLVGPQHTVRKLVVAGLLLLALFFTFAKGEYRVTAETLLEGEVRRVVVAPYRGFLYESGVRAGDIVEEGQVMCNLDTRDLRLEYSRWSSEREQYVAEHRKAVADKDRAMARVLDKKMGQAAAQLALLNEQLARAKIVAPFDGLVVSGDLTQSLGSPVEAGDVLFEVTPLDAYRVHLRVDEREIGQVELGQSGELVLTAMPGTRLPFTVEKITPVSVSEEGGNFFLVEAALDGASERLRPGMEGFGKIDIDRRRLIWIWTHDLIDWVRLKAWSWMP